MDGAADDEAALGRSGLWSYFFRDYVAAAVPFGAINGETAVCHYRFWTLAEIVTAMLAAGYRLKALEERPDWDDPTLPGTFTALAGVD